MQNTFSLSIISPERELFSGEAASVVAPGTQGEFGVLPGHMPFISTLKAGVITVEGEKPMRIAITDGLAEVTPERCIILSESARSLEGLTKADAQAALGHAREAVDKAVTPEQEAAARKQQQLAEVILSGL